MATFGVEKDLQAGEVFTVGPLATIQVAGYATPTQQAAVSQGSGQFLSSSQDNVSAAGTTQAGATPVYNNIVRVTTAATNAGILLPASQAGMEVQVLLGSGIAGTTLKVYPNGTDKINAGAAGAAYSITVASVTAAEFICATAGQWHTISGT